MVVGTLDSAQASEVVCYDGFAISVMIERKAASLWRDRFGGLLSSTGSTETHHPKSALIAVRCQSIVVRMMLSMNGSLQRRLVNFAPAHWI